MDFRRLSSFCAVGFLLALIAACSSNQPRRETSLVSEDWVRQGILLGEETREWDSPLSDDRGSLHGGGGQESDDEDIESLLDLDDDDDDDLDLDDDDDLDLDDDDDLGLDDDDDLDLDDDDDLSLDDDDDVSLDDGDGDVSLDDDDDDDLDLLDDDDDDDTPVVEPAPEPAPTRPAPRPARRPTRQINPGQLIDELGLGKEARREHAAELVRQAEAHRANADLLKAEAALEEAVSVDPGNEAAGRLLDEVRLLLGDSGAGVGATIRDIVNTHKVQKEQARVEIHRLMTQAARHKDEQQYAQAIDAYERVLESIRNYPFDLDLDTIEAEVKTGLAQLERLKSEQEEAEREAFRKMIAEQKAKERNSDLRIVENKLRQLRRKARAAEDARDYKRAVSLYESILLIDARDKEANLRLKIARDNLQTQTQERLRKAYAENYELAVIGIEESSIVYQQIFRYPERDEWFRLAPKVVSLEDEIAASETASERDIKAKLLAKHSLNFEQETSFKDVLNTLREISAINFVLTREGAEHEEETIQLPQYNNLPLESILKIILQTIGSKAGTGFGYAIKDGAVQIGPQESLNVRKYLKFYDINDLISSRPDFKAPGLALDELAGKTGGDESLIDLGGEPEAQGPLETDVLLDLIRKELEGGGDEDDGGGGDEAGISLMAGKLAARTTLANHLKLVKLLKQFRKSTGVMVTVESRFLDINDNFLEEIGVDFGSASNTFLPNTIPDIDGAGTSVQPGYEYVNPQGDYNARIASIGNLSTPLGSAVNPFNLTNEGGGVYQLNVLKAERFQLEAILTGVAKEQEVRRLNSPRVTAFNGQTSHTLVVQQSAYIQDLEVNQTGVIPVINPVIGVLNSGSILEVRPTLSYDRKYVVLELQPTLAEQLESDVARLNLSGNFTVVPVELPVLSVTKIKTTVTVPDGGTVLVGGLKQEIATKTSIGVPGLLDMPILNLILGRRGVSTLRRNLFVLINAKVTVVHEEEARLFGT